MIKDLPDYEGYAVSELGQVYSHKTNQFLKPSFNLKGYPQVCLTLDGRRKKKTVKIHRLVAEMFIPNPNQLPQVNHIDGDKTNNRVENLEWCDNSYNQIHAHRVLGRKGSGGGGGKIPVICVDTGEEYPSLSEAARKTGAKPQNIYRVCKEKAERTAGLKWKYKDGGRKDE